MLNSDAKLNQDLFGGGEFKLVAIRDGFGDGLVRAGEYNKNVVALSADLVESVKMEAFAKKFPDRFFEVGVAEQNLATIAAGLGVSGKIPFIASFAAFSPGRNWEQIRTTIAYNDSNVKIVGGHTGILVGPDGATHQAIEDVATMRVMANMKVFVPCDAIEAEKATLAAAKIWGPTYIRLSRDKSAVLTTRPTPFVPGKAEVFWTPNAKTKAQAVIIGCGQLLHGALLAARDLEKEKIGVIVLNSHTIKPLDEKKIIELARKTGAVVTVEEHQVMGGLGGAVAEVLVKHVPVPMEFVGMRDVFGESGQAGELIEKYGMGVKDIKAAVKRAIRRR